MPKAYQGAITRTYQKLYGYKNLIAWQKADDLAAQVHEVTVHWEPGYYCLSDPMRSAAVSATSNIAEGYCRVSLGDYIRFCEIARGSLGELGSQTTTFRPVTEDSVFLQQSKRNTQNVEQDRHWSGLVCYVEIHRVTDTNAPAF